MTTVPNPAGPDSPYAWRRLAVSLALSTIGGVGLWSSVVVLPVIEAEFGTGRGGASLPYTATMLAFAVGGVMMGRLADRFGIIAPLLISSVMLGGGYILASQAQTYAQYLAVQAGLIGLLGSSTTFAPLLADVTHWFERRRGIAIAVVASGNYLAGTLWPPVLSYAIAGYGWRTAYLGVGVFCICAMLPLSLMLRRRPDVEAAATARPAGLRRGPLPASPRVVQGLLVLAGVGCCVAMSMPQVHMVAYCGDLGYGATRGAEMLSIMLGLGIVSRLASGAISDRIGGLGTLLLGSALQCFSLFLYLPFDGLMSLYVIAAIFGLSQGGIVPSYALIVREYFPAREAGTRVSLVLMATVTGMALGGWMSGEIYDLSGNYRLAFLNGIAWNLMNLSIAFWLLMGRVWPKAAPA